MSEIFLRFNFADNLITVITVIYTIVTFVLWTLSVFGKWIRRRNLVRLLNNKNVCIHIPSRVSKEQLNEVRIKPVVAMEDYNTYEKVRDVLIRITF